MEAKLRSLPTLMEMRKKAMEEQIGCKGRVEHKETFSYNEALQFVQKAVVEITLQHSDGSSCAYNDTQKCFIGEKGRAFGVIVHLKNSEEWPKTEFSYRVVVRVAGVVVHAAAYPGSDGFKAIHVRRAQLNDGTTADIVFEEAGENGAADSKRPAPVPQIVDTNNDGEGPNTVSVEICRVVGTFFGERETDAVKINSNKNGKMIDTKKHRYDHSKKFYDQPGIGAGLRRVTEEGGKQPASKPQMGSTYCMCEPVPFHRSSVRFDCGDHVALRARNAAPAGAGAGAAAPAATPKTEA